MGRPRASYGQQHGSIDRDTEGGPPDSQIKYCGMWLKISGNKVWRWSKDNREWVNGNYKVKTIRRHLITKSAEYSNKN
jgi:hypothetical protein